MNVDSVDVRRLGEWLARRRGAAEAAHAEPPQGGNGLRINADDVGNHAVRSDRITQYQRSFRQGRRRRRQAIGVQPLPPNLFQPYRVFIIQASDDAVGDEDRQQAQDILESGHDDSLKG